MIDAEWGEVMVQSDSDADERAEKSTSLNDVYVYVSHKNGRFAGAMAGCSTMPENMRKEWRREVVAFCGEHIAEGFEITKTYSRNEYETLLKSLKLRRYVDRSDEAKSDAEE